MDQNLVLLQAQAIDPCNGLHQVTFSAFYDNQWHVVGTDTDGSDGWELYWDVGKVSKQIVKVKAFAGDFAGNGVESAINDNITVEGPPKYDLFLPLILR